MNPPDVQVTVEGGVADVQVNKPGITVEVRDYDLDGVDDDQLWTDENGDRCVRYFATYDEEPPCDQQGTAEQPNTPSFDC
jgi:hypothetical protein